MTKPECSKHSGSQVQKPNVEDAVKTENGKTPKTAKDLFSVFAPGDSESDNNSLDNNLKIKKDLDEYEPPRKKSKECSPKRYYTQKYKKEWEKKPEFKGWLSESIHGNTYFYCKFCKKDYKCGISDIHKHMSSKKHAQKAALPPLSTQKFKFKGLLCPVFTPFQDARKITPDVNCNQIDKYADFLNACNVKGILINDIIGEGMSMTTKERMHVTEVWAEVCGRNDQFLMVQIGGAPLKDVVEMALHAKRAAVGAVVVLPDLYNRPKNHLDLIKYLKMVSEYSKDLPMLYHHNPQFTQVEIDVSAFLLNVLDEVDTFVGMIFSTNDLQQSMAAMAVNPDKFTIFMGTEEAILGAVASGLTCIMAASLNFLPKVVESIYESINKGNMKTAHASQLLLNRTIDNILQQGDYIASLKATTELIANNTCGTTTREPVQTLWEGTVKKLQGKLHELGVI